MTSSVLDMLEPGHESCDSPTRELDADMLLTEELSELSYLEIVIKTQLIIWAYSSMRYI